MSVSTSDLTTIRYNLEWAISIARNISFFYTRATFDSVDRKESNLYVKGSYSSSAERGTYEAVLDKAFNIVSLKISPQSR